MLADVLSCITTNPGIKQIRTSAHSVGSNCFSSEDNSIEQSRVSRTNPFTGLPSVQTIPLFQKKIFSIPSENASTRVSCILVRIARQMMDNLGNDAFKRGFCSALVNAEEKHSTMAVSAQLLCNDPKNGIKVLNAFEDDLRNCDNFSISVAFITTSGIEPLLLTLEELEKKKIKGRILTTDYLFFSEPKALRKLNTYSNIEVRLFRCQAGEGFHTKGYIFENPDTIRLIVGSSNWTGAALATNHEWNAHLISKKKALFAETVLKEFNLLWSAKESIPLGDAIDQYEKQWNAARTFKAPTVPFSSSPILLPNPMQQEFVSRLLELQHAGEHRALLISATGT